MPDEEPKKRSRSRKRKLPKIISSEEAERLLRAADDGTERGVRDRLILELMYRAGLRVSEVMNLQLRDVEDDGVIRLYDAKGGDGTAYFDAVRVWPLVERWLKIRVRWAPSNDYLVIDRDSSQVSVRYIQRLVKRLKRQVKITGICTPHVLRHSYATELLEEGFSVSEVQAALRHANLATTAVYLWVRDESLKRKMSARSS